MQPVFAQDTLTEAACADNDIDNDDDGLIEICYLEDLDAIRYVLNGTGYQATSRSTIITIGCPTTPTNGCNGYELVRDLDFTTTQSYASGVVNNNWVLSDSEFTGTAKPGWDPIGGTFTATFEGNGFSISNLHINRNGANDVGLFAQNASVSIIRNLGLREITVQGNENVGGLVGRNNGGKLINVYVEGGTVSIRASSVAGLLVGRNEPGALIINSYAHGSATIAGRWAGGICGFNFGTIRNSYAAAMVTALRDAGGLVGENHGPVINSYSMGSAHITESGRDDRVVGGLVAGLFGSGSVRNSYSTALATSDASNNQRTGGLVGNKSPISLVVENSYWNSTVNDEVTTPANLDGTSQTTDELRMPTAPGTMPTDVYYQWSADDWDFGIATSYPALRYTKGDDSANPACDMDSGTSLPGCSALLPRQSGRDNGLRILYFVLNDEQQNNARVFRNQPFSSLMREYDIKIPYSTKFQLRPYSINSAETISIFRMADSQPTDYFVGKASGEPSIAIPVQANTNEVLTIRVGSVAYTLNIEVGPAARVRIMNFDSTPAPSSTVDEGASIELTATIADGSGNYDYSLQQNGELILGRQGANATETFNVVVPPDLTNTTPSIVYTLTVDDGFDMVSAAIMFMVNRVDNGRPQLKLMSVPLLRVISTAPDPDGVGTFTYLWQRQITESDGWTDIPNADLSTYSINATSTIQYRVIVKHTDGQEYLMNYELGPVVLDVDSDDDGLIELYYLENLNAIRHQLDGTGYKESGAATKITTGCPTTPTIGCNGYELISDLDFMTTQSYVSGAVNNNWVLSDSDFMGTIKQGWAPIGGTFSGILEGNGYDISNLQINRRSAHDIGLFASNNGTIRNLGLSKIKIRGNDTVGGLVGRNQGNLMNVYVNEGDVEGDNGVIGLLIGRNNAGGLIINSYVHGTVSSSDRFVGGIGGVNSDRVINSYAIADISGTGNLGGLIGDNVGSIRNSYAMGSVHLTANANNGSAGGIVNALWQTNNGINPSITNSYSTVAVTSDNNNILGGLIARRLTTDLPVNDSYWDFRQSNQITFSEGGTSQTTVELQTPTNANVATGIYANWSTVDWDFGDENSYPALRYAEGDADNPACDMKPQTPLPNCGALLTAQSGRDTGLSIVFFQMQGETEQRDNAMVFRDQPFSPLLFNYDIKIPYTVAGIQLRPYSFSSTTTISVVKVGENTEYFSGKESGDLSDIISLRAGRNETLAVMVDGLTYNFNLVRGSQTPVEVVSFNTMPPNAIVREGEDITLEAVFGNGSGDYYYWLQQGDMVLAQGQTTVLPTTFTVSLSDTFVEDRQTTQSIVYTITVEDGFDITSATLMLTVNTTDSGGPQLELTVSPTVLRISPTIPDPDGAGEFTYQWQSRDAGDDSWMNLSTADEYMVSGTTASTIRYRVIVEHTDGQGNAQRYTTRPFPIDVDVDNNGLIDIYYLEDLNVLRYQVDGSGYKINSESDNIIADKIALGCRANTCAGYELLRDLDFNADDSYVDATLNKSEWTVGNPTDPMDTGWLPVATSSTSFATLFNGNNNKISNLQINRDTLSDAYIGLFAALSSEARIENVGILDVDIEGRGYVGSLVAQNKGAIVNSYVYRGEVMGAQHNLGGLVAINDSDDSATGVIVNSYADVMVMSTSALLVGGLVGNNKGKIRNSYAAGNVSGACDVGGLVAENSNGSEIINGYASGAVSRSGSCTGDSTRERAGGLVVNNAGLIRNSYVSGRITGGGGTVGGLIAVETSGTVVELSFWDSTINDGITVNTEAKTSIELQTPTAPGTTSTAVYYQWSTADWDFGTPMHYPILRYNSPTSDVSTVSVCDDDLDTPLPPCGGLLLAQGDKGLSNLLFFTNSSPVTLNKPFSLSILSGYTIDLINKTMLELLPYGINPRGEFISITLVGDTASTNYFIDKHSGERSLPITLAEGESVLTVSVGTDSIDTDLVAYSITVNNTASPVKITSINVVPDPVNEGPISLSATVAGGDPSIHSYHWTSVPEDFLAGQTGTSATLSFNIPNDFVPSGDASRDVIIKLTVGDVFSQDSAVTTVTIVRTDNGEPSFTETETSSTISIEVVAGSDPDGDGTIEGYTWQRRGAGDTDWTTIDGEASAMYNIPILDKGDTLYRVQVASVDGQGNSFTSVLGPYRNRTDIDDDDDGLIDIYYLEDLNAVRHQPDGSGYQASSGATEITVGCMPACMGYELRRDLDFTIAENYADAMTNKEAWTVDDFDTAGDTGWQPIGSVAGNSCSSTNSRCFSSTFEGNGHSISNLQINRDGVDEIGMFAGNTGTIRNFGLREITVQGNIRVGGLVGRNEGNLINTYVNQGNIEGENNTIGGLVGVSLSGALIINSYVRGTVTSKLRFVGGICGFNFGRVINSYADAMVTGAGNAGGLVGESHGSIINSYSMGSADVTEVNVLPNQSVGGLVAGLFGAGSIRNSYSTAKATSAGSDNQRTGGLIGRRGSTSLVIENSYWNSTVNDEVSAPTRLYGTPATTEELQMSTAQDSTPTDVYYQWTTVDWDFGDSMSYPKLRHNEITGVDACRSMNETAPLPFCGSLLPGQGTSLPEANTPPMTTITPSVAQMLPLNGMTDIMVSVEDTGDTVTLTAMSSAPTVVSVSPAEFTGITDNTTRTFTLNALQGGMATVTFTATDSRGSSVSTDLSVRINTPPQVLPIPTPFVATVGEAFRLETSRYFSDADNDNLTYSITPNNLRDNLSTTGTLTFTPAMADASQTTAGFTITVSVDDGNGGTAQATFTLLIDAPPTPPSGGVSIQRDPVNRWLLRSTSTIMDGNGIATTDYQWYRDNMPVGTNISTYQIDDDNGRNAGATYRLDVTIVDNIGRSAARSGTITITNEAPVIDGPITVSPSPVDEGQEVTITIRVRDANNDRLTYSWSVTSGHSGINLSGNPAILRIPANLVDAASTSATVSWGVVVSDGAASVTGAVSVVVNKGR